MIKQISILFLLLVAVIGGLAATKGRTGIEAASPAVRNSIIFNNQQLAVNIIDSYIDLTNLAEGDETCMFLSNTGIDYISIKMINVIKILSVVSGDTISEELVIDVNGLTLRANVEPTIFYFEYCIDGLNFNKIGDNHQLKAFTKSDDLIDVFYNKPTSSKGIVEIDWFYLKNTNEPRLQYAENTFDVPAQKNSPTFEAGLFKNSF